MVGAEVGNEVGTRVGTGVGAIVGTDVGDGVVMITMDPLVVFAPRTKLPRRLHEQVTASDVYPDTTEQSSSEKSESASSQYKQLGAT
jgi:hypothetical protein